MSAFVWVKRYEYSIWLQNTHYRVLSPTYVVIPLHIIRPPAAPTGCMGHGLTAVIIVCLSVCHVPDPNSRTEWRSKLKIGRKEA